MDPWADSRWLESCELIADSYRLIGFRLNAGLGHQLSLLRSAEMQQVHGPVTRGDRAHQDVHLRSLTGLGDEGITCPDLRRHRTSRLHAPDAGTRRAPVPPRQAWRRGAPSPPTFPTFVARGSRDRSRARCSESDRANPQTTRSACHRDGGHRTGFRDRWREVVTRPVRPGQRARARRTSHSYMRCGIRGTGRSRPVGPTAPATGRGSRRRRRPIPAPRADTRRGDRVCCATWHSAFRSTTMSRRQLAFPRSRARTSWRT